MPLSAMYSHVNIVMPALKIELYLEHPLVVGVHKGECLAEKRRHVRLVH